MIVITVLAIGSMLGRMGMFMVSSLSCYHWIDYLCSVLILVQILMVLKWVSTHCSEILKMQQEELLLAEVVRQSNGRGKMIMSVNLELLWDRVSRFQIYLYGLFFSAITWVLRTIVYSVFSMDYREANTCEIIYGLILNKVHPQEGMDEFWSWASALCTFAQNLLMFIIPTIFTFIIVEITLIKDR